MTLAKETQEDRWPSRIAFHLMTNGGCSRASFPGVMAAVELESMACTPGCQRLLVGLTIR